MPVQRLSIEVTNYCNKGCSFCYNNSNTHGATEWTPDEIVNFVLDCRKKGIEAISFGGGEPLVYKGIFEVLNELKGKIYRSMTTNGLMLDHIKTFQSLVSANPDKVHVSIHDVEDSHEVKRVLEQVNALEENGITSGINLLVRHSTIPAAKEVVHYIRSKGIGPKGIIYIPMHGADSPSPKEIAEVAGEKPFQSVSCLTGCRISPRFCSISWDKEVGWCSYTSSRKKLNDLSAAGLSSALKGLALEYCGSNLPRS